MCPRCRIVVPMFCTYMGGLFWACNCNQEISGQCIRYDKERPILLLTSKNARMFWDHTFMIATWGIKHIYNNVGDMIKYYNYVCVTVGNYLVLILLSVSASILRTTITLWVHLYWDNNHVVSASILRQQSCCESIYIEEKQSYCWLFMSNSC